MKKYVLVLGMMFLGFNGQAQFDFLLKAVMDIGGTVLADPGKVLNTGEDIRMIKESIELIDGAICMVKEQDKSYNTNMDYSITDGCYIPTDVMLDIQVLDQAKIAMAEQLMIVGATAVNAVSSIGSDKEPEKINRGIIAESLAKVKGVLLARIAEKLKRQQKIKRYERKGLEMMEALQADMVFSDPSLSPLTFTRRDTNTAIRSERNKARTRYESVMTNLKEFMPMVVSVLFVIMLCGTTFGLATGSTRFEPEMLVGMVVVMVLLSVVNAMW